MSRLTSVVLPDFRRPNISKWLQTKLSGLITYLMNSSGMTTEGVIGISLIRNSPFVYNEALENNKTLSAASFCNISAANIGPFVPKLEWKLSTQANRTNVDDNFGGKCQWNISGRIIELPNCLMMYLDPASRYNSSDIIGVQGTMCPVSKHISAELNQSHQHISMHNAYALNHAKQTRSSLDLLGQLNKTFVFSQHSSTSIGQHGGVLGSRFNSSWEGMKVSRTDVIFYI